MAELGERVGFNSASVNLEEIADKRRAVSCTLAIHKEVGQSGDLTVDLGQSFIGLEGLPPHGSEFHQRHMKIVFDDALARSRHTAGIAATERPAKTARCKAFHVAGGGFDRPKTTALARQRTGFPHLRKELMGRLVVDGFWFLFDSDDAVNRVVVCWIGGLIKKPCGLCGGPVNAERTSNQRLYFF